MMAEESAKTLWRADPEQFHAVEVECPDGGHPASDADGIPIYGNTHFATEKKAWESLRTEFDAWISLSAASLTSAEKAVRRCQCECGKACQGSATVRGNHARRLATLAME